MIREKNAEKQTQNHELIFSICLKFTKEEKKLYAFNGIWAYNLRVTVVMHYQLSYGAKQEAG